MNFVPTRQVITVLGAGVATALLLGAGCENASARQRAENQAIIAEAGRDLELAALSAWDPGDESATDQRRRLDDIIKKISRMQVEGGQEVAVAMISSSANRELARISLSQAEVIEAQNRDLYESLHSNVDAAMRLKGLADGIEGVTTVELRAMLAGERAAAQNRLRDYSRRVAELDGPISERENENEQDAREASRLEDEAIALRRQAAEWGHAAGLATYEQALSLEREADGYEYRIAWRESDLQYDLRPEHELADTRAAALSKLLNDIAETEKSLQARDDLGAREVEATRGLIRAYRDQIDSSLKLVEERTRGELADHYNEAQRHLEKSVTQAKTAAQKSNRGEEDAARLTLVRAYERQGQLFTTRARSLDAHAEVLERIIDGGIASGDTSALRSKLRDLRTGSAEAIEQARAQLTNASEQLDRVKSKTNQTEIDAFKQGLMKTLSSLGATASEEDPPQETTRRRGRSGGDKPRAESAAGGYGSAEELLAMIRSADPDDPGSMERMLDAVHTSTPAATRLLEMQQRLIKPQRELFSAMADEFGAAPGEMMSGMGGAALASAEDAKIIDQTEDRATVEAPGAPPITLVKVDGTWKVDGDAMFGNMGGAGMGQMEAVMGAMPKLLADIAGRIRAGEFSGPDQVMQTMMAELMGAMGGSGGAAAGVPGK